MDSDILHIYTDGACSGNPGRGGWGVYIEKGIEKMSWVSISLVLLLKS
jgi:ribonuclease HI